MTSSQRVLHLVDSIEYVESNCFQHQLLKALRSVAQVETCALSALDRALDMGPRPVVCCLKQRTLHRELDRIADQLGDTPVVIYDQDPWHAFMDDSLYKGVYQQAAAKLNVKAFAVTTQLWADHIAKQGLPSRFVRMWVLPEYCARTPVYEDRPIRLGFIGSLHPHRQRLFDRLDELDVQVNVQSGNALPYRDYLKALSNIRVFIHTEDNGIFVDKQPMNLADALWIKDIEAAARGCFTLRNRGKGSETYYEGANTCLLYDSVDEIPGILEGLERMQKNERQSLINGTVDYIQRSDRWQETAQALTTF
jgi:hypothetical protein